MKLLEVREISKEGNIENAVSKIRPPIFWKDKATFTLQAQKWNKYKIKKMLEQTFMIELKIKSNSQITKGLLIKKLLIDICCLANTS